MKLFQQIFLTFLLSVFLLPLSAQDAHSHDHDHDHDPHKHHIGFGIAATKLLNENVLAPGFHVHFIRQLGHHNQWGLGVGLEVIADENWHSGLNLLFNYRPLRFLSLLAGPGLAVVKHEGDVEFLPAFHTEAVFEFDIGNLHVGPMIGYERDTEHSHFSVGIHIGIGF
jgi:hypothetical protein